MNKITRIGSQERFFPSHIVNPGSDAGYALALSTTSGRMRSVPPRGSGWVLQRN